MAAAAEKHGEPPYPAGHTSHSLRLLIEGLEQRQDGQILDVGPARGANIGFLAHRIRRLCVCDLFSWLDRYQRESLPLGWVLRHLDYPPESFDGILLWDLIDHLEDANVRTLVRLCQTTLKPGGMVMVLVQSERALSSKACFFVIGQSFRIHLDPQPHLALPHHGRPNRDILALFTPLALLKSFIYRNGIREFLFKKA